MSDEPTFLEVPACSNRLAITGAFKEQPSQLVSLCAPPVHVSIRYTERLAEAGIEPSVGSVGNSYDNALAETINGLFKAEVIHRRSSWRRIEALELATLHWVGWFNHRQLLAPIVTVRCRFRLPKS